ncbi:MAG: alpha/beta fold hydrolase [Bradymonadaceae bacterium]
MERIGFRANGLTFRALRCEGETSDERALFLHGFPDQARSMVPVMRRLARERWVGVAPWMRGYAPTQLAPDDDYTMGALAADVIGMLDALDWERATLVGHDWGAVAAYAAANLAPSRVARIVGVSVPPLSIFVRNALVTPAQWSKSAYMLWFQLPGLAEYLLSRDDYRALEAAGPPPEVDDIDWSEGVIDSFSTPGTLSAALKYYRSLVPGRPDCGGDGLESWRLALQTVERPTLLVAGIDDPWIGPEMFEGPARAIDARHEVRRFVDTGHFVPVERPDRLTDAILGFVG